MKIGFPNNPRKDIVEEIKWIGRNGFDFVDLFLEEDRAVPEKIDIKKVKKILKEYKLDTMGHTAFYLPISSPMKSLRDASVNEAERYFKVFNKLGVKFVTIHPNWSRGMFSTKEKIKFQIETLKRIVKKARKYDIKMMYESSVTEKDNMKNISEILDSVPGLFFHLDIGHANLFGRKPEQFIKKFHKKLVHVHLHDNRGKYDLHLPMGCGNIDWKKTLKTLKRYYDGTITLETFPKDKDYVLLSKKKLRKLWDSL